jgi:hypothetical protein
MEPHCRRLINTDGGGLVVASKQSGEHRLILFGVFYLIVIHGLMPYSNPTGTVKDL